MKKFFTIPTVPAILLIFVFILSSCSLIIINDVNKPNGDSDSGGGDGNGEIITVTPYEKPDDGYGKSQSLLESLDVIDLQGSKTVFAVSDEEFFKGDGTETVLNSDKIARIKAVQDKLNTEIILKSGTAAEIASAIKSNHNSGVLYADVVALPASYIGVLAADGLIASLRSLPNLNLDAEYFNQSSISAASAGNSIYGVAGDGCFDASGIMCMYCNRDLLSLCGISDLSEIVKSGNWTLDKYNEILSAATVADIRSYQVGKANVACVLLGGSGLTTVSSVVDEVPSWRIADGDFTNISQKITEIMKYGVQDDAFISGNALFCFDTISACKQYATTSFKSSLLPLPKSDAQSSYCSYAGEDALYMCVLSDHYSFRTASDLIECFSAASYNYIREHYIDECVTNSLRDEVSIYALTASLSDIRYDFTAVFGTGYKGLSSCTSDVFASIVAGEEIDLESAKKKGEEYLSKTFPAPYK